MPVTGDELRAMAAMMVADLQQANFIGNDVYFQASAGWLEAFKRRHEIREQWLLGDGGSVNAAAVDDAIPAIVDEVEGGRQGLTTGLLHGRDYTILHCKLVLSAFTFL